MAAETDTFVVASAALWAGDFYHFETLMRKFVSQRGPRSSREEMTDPEAIIITTGEIRLRQLWQKRGEFRKLANSQSRDGDILTDKPIILETVHLRATLWRTGAREFLMQGFLTDLGFGNRFFENARMVAKVAGGSATPSKLGNWESPEVRGEVKMPLGASWYVPGDLSIQVELTDMGLLEAAGMWTERNLPDDARLISGKFENVMLSLDPPERTDVHKVLDE